MIHSISREVLDDLAWYKCCFSLKNVLNECIHLSTSSTQIPQYMVWREWEGTTEKSEGHFIPWVGLTDNIWAAGVALEAVQSQATSVEHARTGANQFGREKSSHLLILQLSPVQRHYSIISMSWVLWSTLGVSPHNLVLGLLPKKAIQFEDDSLEVIRSCFFIVNALFCG